VAVAASILAAIYHMLKDGTMYHDLGPNHDGSAPPYQTQPNVIAFRRKPQKDRSAQVMLKVEEFADELRAQVARELRGQVEAFWSVIDYPRDASLRDRRL
jgi:hypothetical protein